MYFCFLLIVERKTSDDRTPVLSRSSLGDALAKLDSQEAGSPSRPPLPFTKAGTLPFMEPETHLEKFKRYTVGKKLFLQNQLN